MQELTRLRDTQEQLAAWQDEAKFADEFSLQLQASLDEVRRSSLGGHHALLAALHADQESFEAHAAAKAASRGARPAARTAARRRGGGHVARRAAAGRARAARAAGAGAHAADRARAHQLVAASRRRALGVRNRG